MIARLSALWVPAFWFAMGASFFAALAPMPPAPAGAPNDKVQHILAFLVLTTLCCLAYPAASMRRILLGMLGFGALIEIVQAIPELGRSSEWLDLLADAAATVAALTIMAIVRRAMR